MSVFFLFSLGTIVSTKRNWKQSLCKIWGGGGGTKSIMVLSEVANWPFGLAFKRKNSKEYLTLNEAKRANLQLQKRTLKKAAKV